ncbi:1938_t:CDS:2, partial [Gigaspora rosea]
KKTWFNIPVTPGALDNTWYRRNIRSMLGVKNFAKTCQALKESNQFFPREEAPQERMMLIDNNRKKDWFLTSAMENSSKEIYRVSKKSK